LKENEKYFNRLQVALDALVIIFSYMTGWYVMISSSRRGGIGVLPREFYLMALVAIVPFFLILYYAFDLYVPNRLEGRRREGSNIIKANAVGGLAAMAVLFLIRQMDASRMLLSVFLVLNVTLTVLERNLIRMVLMRARSLGLNQRYILLVGYSRAAEEYIDRIVQNPQWGYKVLGILSDDTEAGTRYKGVEVLGPIGSLNTLLTYHTPDEIAITVGLNEYYKLERIVAMCEKSGVHTKFIPDYSNIIPTKPYTEDILGLPVINIRHVPLSNTFNATMKRIVDVAGSVFCIVLFSPVMLLTAVAIKATSKGPIIFSQERVGLHNKPFRMYKFRSMEQQTETAAGGGSFSPDNNRGICSRSARPEKQAAMVFVSGSDILRFSLSEAPLHSPNERRKKFPDAPPERLPGQNFGETAVSHCNYVNESPPRPRSKRLLFETESASRQKSCLH